MEPVKVIKNFLIEDNGENGIVIKQRKRLYFSAFMMDELDQYIADNYAVLKAEGALSFKMPSEVKRVNTWATCNTDYTVIATFPAVSNVEKKGLFEDLDLDINYKRFFDYKDLTDIDGKPAINCRFSISFDTVNGDEIEISILKHYASYLALGITTVDLDSIFATNYISNDIQQTVLLPTPTPTLETLEAEVR